MQPNDQQSSSDGNETPVTPTEKNNSEAAGTVIEPSVPTEPVATATENKTDVDGSASVPTQPSPASADQPSTAESVAAPAAAGARLGGKGSKKKLGIVLGIIAVILLLVGGSAGAYFGIIAPQQPQRIVQDSLRNTVNTEKLSSGKFEGELTCTEGEACKSLSAVTFEGAFNDKQHLDAKIVVNTTVTKINFDVRSVGDKSVYLRLTGLEGLDKLLASSLGQNSSASAAMAKQLAPIIAKINNQWYAIDENLLNQAGGVTLPNNSNKISEDDAKKIGDIYKKHQFIKVDKKLADEDIHGIASYHVQATIDKDQLKAFLGELKNANINGIKLEQKDIDQITSADLSKYPFDLWVGKSSRTITQIATTIKEREQTVKLRLALFDTNKPVNVEKPEGAKSILELVSEFAPLYSGGVQGASSDSPTSLLGF